MESGGMKEGIVDFVAETWRAATKAQAPPAFGVCQKYRSPTCLLSGLSQNPIFSFNLPKKRGPDRSTDTGPR